MTIRSTQYAINNRNVTMLLVTALAGHLTFQLAGLIRKLHSGRYSIVVQILMQIVRQFLVE